MLGLGEARRGVAGLVGDDAEALIREARRRTRRRRLRGGIGVLAVAVVVLLTVFATVGGGKGIVAETASRPFVNVRAFGREGKLAFVSRGTLWVLDGASGTLRKLHVPGGAAPAAPAFSRDGRWLAYLAVPADRSLASQLWIADADGSHARQVAKLRVDQLVGWSPTGDVLAIVAQAPGWYGGDQRGQVAAAVDLVRPTGATERLVTLHTSAAEPGYIEGALWSPDGREIAVSTVRGGGPTVSSTVRAYPLAGGHVTTWFSIRHDQRLLPALCSPDCPATGVFADLAGWSPKWGIVFWSLCCGGTRSLDQTPLFVLDAPGSRPRLLAQTLWGDATEPVVGGPGGALAVVETNSAGRLYGRGKIVEHCTTRTRSCSPVPGGSTWTGPDNQPCPAGSTCTHPPPGTPGSGVTLEPAWSPTAPLLAYVKAPYSLTPDPTIGWYETHELYLWNARTGTTRKITTVSGVSVPTWSRNGRDLLYVSDNGLWLVPASGGAPVNIEHPLFAKSAWNGIASNEPPLATSYFGRTDWIGQFSWSSP